MKESKMFRFMKPKIAGEVAMTGYKASCRGKTLRYYGATVKVMNLGSRRFPRAFSRKFARMINE